MRNGDGKPTVLIVEDDKYLGSALGTLLEYEGYRSVVAHSGADAVDGQHGNNFDAALIDVHLPDMNGLALASLLRTQYGPSWPILVMTGDLSKDVLGNIHESGATHFFCKPLNLDRLVSTLGKSMSPESSQRTDEEE